MPPAIPCSDQFVWSEGVQLRHPTTVPIQLPIETISAVAVVFTCVVLLTRAIRRRLRRSLEGCHGPMLVRNHSGSGSKPDQKSRIAGDQCCTSFQTAWALGPTCQQQRLEPLLPRPPEPTVQYYHGRDSPPADPYATKFVTHSTFLRGISLSPPGSGAFLYGEVWQAHDLAKRSGWRRKQWTVMPH